MNIRDLKTIQQRRNFINKLLKLELSKVGKYPKDLESAQYTNCENMIGATCIPLGVAGPISISGGFAKGDFYIPLSTTEAALVASVARGCKAVRESGGVTVRVESVGVTRGPVFKTSGIKESLKFKSWLDKNFEKLQKIASQTSRHLTLAKTETTISGKNVYARFYFDTQEAMGMNMVTIATTAIVDAIEKETKIKCLSVAGNYDIDKKPAWLNMISGRGKRVWAEATIKANILKTVLKTTASSIYDVWLAKCMVGSAMSGSMGFNAHFANIITALFIATGQDTASAVEGSIGMTTTEVIEEDLYICVYIPDLMVGAVGGGTKLPTQKEALSILAIMGEKNSSLKLAEIVGAAVLAGEVSLLASLSVGSLATAHIHLARGKNK